MASIPLSPRFPPVTDRRLGGVLATILLHAALVLGWQLARTLPPVPADADSPVTQWIQLPPTVLEASPPQAAAPQQAPAPARPAPGRSAAPTPSSRSAPAASPAAQPETPAPLVQETAPPPEETPGRPSAADIMESARRSVGSIDRALRKQNKPLIVAQPDSPELRMRRGMEQAHALAPPGLFEAPKVEELVNNTGDGARRTRVITGRRTYCITERSPATKVEMIEMHGKIRLTNCPTPEAPAKRQEWRTEKD